MGEEYRAKVFKSGNSLALRLPKALGLTEGTEMIVREERVGFSIEPAETKRKFNVEKVWGLIPDLQPIAPEDRLFEERELDWEGKLLPKDD
jgi:antitoxin VapB